MTFTQVTFLIFFPITIFAYFLVPQRLKYVWLLFCSYVFYLGQDQAMVWYLLMVTLIAYGAGLVFEKLPTDSGQIVPPHQFKSTVSSHIAYRKITLAASATLLIGGLGFFKYAPVADMGLFMPIGISFFTFQALSYIIDCYRGDVTAEKNLFKVALFVSFFPTILAGPIQRGKSFMPQLMCDYTFDTERVKNGMFTMLWGYFLKVVISGRLTIMTTQVFGGYRNYSGSMLLVAAVGYAFLIYCDFAGYSFIAIGAAKIMGFDLGINFRQPYLSGSIGEFWRRWHISLSGWFRDYLYIPLGGSRKGVFRKYINVMIVFAVSGIWHGNTVNFLVWGLLNGAYQVAGQILSPVKAWLSRITHVDNRPTVRRVFAIAGSFILLDIAWVFFAIPNFSDSLNVLGRIFTQFNFVDLINGTVFSLGLGVRNLVIAAFGILVLVIADVMCEINRCDITGLLPRMGTVVRWAVYYGMTVMILMSLNLSRTEFIYSQF